MAPIVLGVAWLGVLFDFRWIVPSLESLRDNVWAALTVAIVLAVFLRMTNMSSHRVHSENPDALNALVRNRATRINELFGEIVNRVAERHRISRDVLIAILVYEDLNRPKWFRQIENLIVRFPLSVTVGIAQVRSGRSLSDAESIEAMGPIVAQFFDEAKERNECRPEFYVFREYNGSIKYAENVQRIYELL